MGVGGGELGLGYASLGPGGQQVAAQDLRPGAGALVEDSGPTSGPALPGTLLVHLQTPPTHSVTHAQSLPMLSCYTCSISCSSWFPCLMVSRYSC